MQTRRAFGRKSTAIAIAGIAAVATVGAVGTGAHASTDGVTVSSNVAYTTDGGAPVLLDAYLPTAPVSSATPAAIFVHGGGWAGGDKSEWATEARNFTASTGWPAFSMNYVLNAPNPYWEEYWDVHLAIDWVKANATTYGVDPSRLGLVGDSAGGQLALLAADYGTGGSSGDGRVKAVVSWSGVPDATLAAKDEGCSSICNFNTQPVSAMLENNYEKVSPAAGPSRWAATSAVNHVDVTDPPTLLVNSTHELIPLDQLTEMQADLARAGVPVSTVVLPGTQHAMDYSPQAWPPTLQFLQQQLSA